MAFIEPNGTYKMNGVLVREKIIPDGTCWNDEGKAKKAGFKKKALYKAQKKLSANTGMPQWITIHNTDDIASVNDDAMQYVAATYAENMGASRVHFYVDDLGAWQLLKAGTGLTAADPEGSAEVSWHSGDGNDLEGGNMTSISIEVIMSGNDERDALAYENSIKIAAWLLQKHQLPIDRVVSHTYWVNRADGVFFGDTAMQSTNPIYNKKWCPKYIFNSDSFSIALENWRAYRSLIEKEFYILEDERIKSKLDNFPDEWAKDAVEWAKRNGIIVGDDSGNLHLRRNINRQELLTFLYRALNK